MGSDGGSAQSTSKAGISGVAGDSAARTGDAPTGLKPIFDKEQVRQEVAAQVAITGEFSKRAVPAVAAYADAQAVALRREGREDEARRWDEGGEYRVALHGGVGALTGGSAGALGAGTSAALVPVVGEAIAGMNLAEPVRQGLTTVAGTLIGAATGGADGAAAAFNQTALNYVSHSPFAQVRRTVSQENARLLNACGTQCTADDLRRIDQQMDKKNISTFFPPDWSRARIEFEVTEAFKMRQMHGNTKWTGTSPSGIVIEGYTSPSRTTFYPTR